MFTSIDIATELLFSFFICTSVSPVFIVRDLFLPFRSRKTPAAATKASRTMTRPLTRRSPGREWPWMERGLRGWSGMDCLPTGCPGNRDRSAAQSVLQPKPDLSGSLRSQPPSLSHCSRPVCPYSFDQSNYEENSMLGSLT